MPRSPLARLPRRWRLFLLVAPLALVADQLTKCWARASLPADRTVPVIEHYFDWSLSTNTGSAFSVFHGSAAMVILSIVGAVALAAVLWMVHHARDQRTLLVVGLSAIAGGAAGNLLDRAVSHGVTDFVRWHYYDHSWPTFNVADALLLGGVLLLFLDGFRRHRSDPPAT